MKSLRIDRALRTATISLYETYVRQFFHHLQDLGLVEWTELSRESIYGFLAVQGKTIGRRGMHCVCCALRSLLRFLRMVGHALVPGLEGFPRPRIYRLEDLPTFLRPDQVRQVLEAVRRETLQGIRNYAILLLLTICGLRAAEVARLTLDDIDWATEKLLLRLRKSGRSDVLPLSHPVGEAILEYLQKVRPKTACRQIFLTMQAPLRPFRTGGPVSSMAHKHLVAAGINLPRLGAHVLRHTCAHNLLKKGFSYKIIGDYLGHSCASSTSVYLKVDLEGLLQVARNDGEDLL